MLGCILVPRNHDMKNAGIPGVTLYFGDNNDIKLPYRMPIMPETHENTCSKTCHQAIDPERVQYQVHLSMRATVCYSVGYSSKMQVFGTVSYTHLTLPTSYPV